MGDMKTPDFDDLLAAFDIPDIDAKEAIQSSPEEVGEENAEDSPSCSPSSPVCQSSPLVVSVIVKNRVRPESYGEMQNAVSDDTKSSLDNMDSLLSSSIDPKDEGKLGETLLVSQLGPKTPDDVPLEPQKHNGFEESASTPKGQANGDPWSHISPLRSIQTSSEGGGNEGVEVGSVSHTADIMDRLNPLLYPQSSTSTAPSAPLPLTSSSSPSPVSVNQHSSPHPTQREERSHPRNSPSSSPSRNRSMRAVMRHITEPDEEDSEPDLGSPLVIQENLESPMSSPTKFLQRPQVSSELLDSPETLPCSFSSSPQFSSLLTSLKSEPHPELPSTHSSTSTVTQPQGTEACHSSNLTGSITDKEEKYPEHVIDERDSPESPPPDQMGYVVPKTSPSPPLAPALAVASSLQDCHNPEEPMESELSQESRAEVLSEVEGEKMEVGDGENTEKENSDAGSSTADSMTDSANVAETVSPPSRPLKVKIKTVKTPTGSITRTITGVAPKSVRGTSSLGVDGSKPSPRSHQIMSKPKRKVSQQAEKRTSKAGGTLPAALMLQDASIAMLAAASKVKNKTAVDTKPKVSATAVSITRSAALPSVSAPRVSSGGVNMRSLGQKTLTSGMTVPSPAPPLVPPQGSSRPASIVNSTGAIISKSQSNLVEAFNKILNSKNLLPSYKPDLTSPLPAEWGLPLPAQGYRCLECGDSFALERSLVRHYDRRSLRIEVTCNHCAKRLAFFNKCSLLLHAREHKERGLVMQCSHLVMRPLTVEQMIGQQEPTAIAPKLQQPVPSKKAEAVQYTGNKCPECQLQFSSKEEVAAHFQEIKPAHSTPCTECTPPMLLPNSCSAASHQRIHKACPPHVCPECGGTAKQSSFQSHLQDTCLHFARRIGYRCSSCQVVVGGLNSVKSHIQTAHCDMFHKCPSCPMAFKSAPSIQSHITAQHPTLTGGQAKLIYKCVMCDTVFTQKSLLYVHFDTHLANQKVHVFKCPECTKLYSQRNSLMDHIKSSHKAPAVQQDLPPSPAKRPRSRAPVRTETLDKEEWTDDEEEKVNGEKTKTISRWNCVPCHARYTDREDFIVHMAEQHGKILKKFPCNKCESSFTSTSSLRRHIRVKHKGIKRGFHCQFCTEGQKTFSSRVMLERHIQLRHSVDAASQDTLLGGGGLDEAGSSSEQEESAPRQGRKGAVTTVQEEACRDGASPVKKSRTSSSVPSPSPRRESGFCCAPCGFTTEDHEDFLQHIPRHRNEGAGGDGLQCLQCGACFTSASSLSRHRFITHKVRDATPDGPRGLIDRPPHSPGNGWNHDAASPRGGSGPASPSAPQGRDGEGKLSCKVCGKHFDKTTDLNTHFRTHGMAFISARNSGKTT
ncbi:zinc finger protein 687a isoform 2-T3 [Polymixia lowei]